MSKDKCCGNCEHFKDEDVNGKGWCEEQSWITECSKVCKCHKPNLNGWTEITPDNVEELNNLPENRLIISFKLGSFIYYQKKAYFRPSLESIAKKGGYYYYVLPELKIK